MGGIKHSMWGQFPDAPKDQADWQTKQVLNHKTFCKLCGGQIVQASEDADGKATNWAWEMQNDVHYACYTDYIEKLRSGQYGNQG